MHEVFLRPREVEYRLGQHRVTTFIADLTVSGMDVLKVIESSMDMEDMVMNVTIDFPEIRLSGNFNASGSISGLQKERLVYLRTSFPSYGFGDIEAVIANTTAVARAELGHSVNDRKLAVELLICDVAFGDPEVRLSSVKIPRALEKLDFVRLFGEAVRKMILHQMTAEIEPSVEASLHEAITKELDRVTLDREAIEDHWRQANSDRI
ncbi:uncharacterized protein LOC119103829 [Pollicipes pollicipes]|uniref:uncharacterized protein LOC119103829 n=1 Tax=Pollicipes pollicipes TaxID=41117 RepID=UPI0018851E22|nr:uncharacterized protein LOC119103829 [Pollicipes pollicipes]